jgi:hypothetical protein
VEGSTASTLGEYPGTRTPYLEELKTDLTINTFLPLQEVLQWPNTPKRKFKRNNGRTSFVITCRAWKALFQEKENKKKKT